MILSLFLVLMLIAVFLIVIGIWTREGVYNIVGFAFIFFLSVFVFMSGNISVINGSNVTVSYSYVNGTVSSSDIVASDNVDYFDDSTSKWFGRWLAIVSALGLVLSLIEGSKIFRGKSKDE